MTLGTLGPSPNSPFDLLTIVHLLMFGTRASSWYIDSLTFTTLNLTLHNAFCLASTKAGTNLMNIQKKMPLTFDGNNFCCVCDDYFFQSFL